jgi:hypothetical protein
MSRSKRTTTRAVNLMRMISSTILRIFLLVGMESKIKWWLVLTFSRPIPYWLYNLHGLGIEYKCEICGNYSYWGRRAFERHFSEWRHSYGMKCLRIPNTVHFKDITSINDALVRKKPGSDLDVLIFSTQKTPARNRSESVQSRSRRRIRG